MANFSWPLSTTSPVQSRTVTSTYLYSEVLPYNTTYTIQFTPGAGTYLKNEKVAHYYWEPSTSNWQEESNVPYEKGYPEGTLKDPLTEEDLGSIKRIYGDMVPNSKGISALYWYEGGKIEYNKEYPSPPSDTEFHFRGNETETISTYESWRYFETVAGDSSMHTRWFYNTKSYSRSSTWQNPTTIKEKSKDLSYVVDSAKSTVTAPANYSEGNYSYTYTQLPDNGPLKKYKETTTVAIYRYTGGDTLKAKTSTSKDELDALKNKPVYADDNSALYVYLNSVGISQYTVTTTKYKAVEDTNIQNVTYPTTGTYIGTVSGLTSKPSDDESATTGTFKKVLYYYTDIKPYWKYENVIKYTWNAAAYYEWSTSGTTEEVTSKPSGAHTSAPGKNAAAPKSSTDTWVYYTLKEHYWTASWSQKHTVTSKTVNAKWEDESSPTIQYTRPIGINGSASLPTDAKTGDKVSYFTQGKGTNPETGALVTTYTVYYKICTEGQHTEYSESIGSWTSVSSSTKFSSEPPTSCNGKSETSSHTIYDGVSEHTIYTKTTLTAVAKGAYESEKLGNGTTYSDPSTYNKTPGNGQTYYDGTFYLTTYYEANQYAKNYIPHYGWVQDGDPTITRDLIARNSGEDIDKVTAKKDATHTTVRSEPYLYYISYKEYTKNSTAESSSSSSTYKDSSFNASESNEHVMDGTYYALKVTTIAAPETYWQGGYTCVREELLYKNNEWQYEPLEDAYNIPSDTEVSVQKLPDVSASNDAGVTIITKVTPKYYYNTNRRLETRHDIWKQYYIDYEVVQGYTPSADSSATSPAASTKLAVSVDNGATWLEKANGSSVTTTSDPKKVPFLVFKSYAAAPSTDHYYEVQSEHTVTEHAVKWTNMATTSLLVVDSSTAELPLYSQPTHLPINHAAMSLAFGSDTILKSYYQEYTSKDGNRYVYFAAPAFKITGRGYKYGLWKDFSFTINVEYYNPSTSTWTKAFDVSASAQAVSAEIFGGPSSCSQTKYCNVKGQTSAFTTSIKTYIWRLKLASIPSEGLKVWLDIYGFGNTAADKWDSQVKDHYLHSINIIVADTNNSTNDEASVLNAALNTESTTETPNYGTIVTATNGKGLVPKGADFPDKFKDN